MTELHGALCRLRPYTMSDAAALERLAGDFQVARWMTAGFPHPYTREDAERWLGIATADDPPNNFAILSAGEFAGGIGIGPRYGEHNGTAIFGYWLGRRFWGRGLATDAARTFARYAFAERGLRRLEATVFASNPVSARVLEKAGFRFEGRMRESYVDREGQVVDGLLYARVAGDPEP